MEDKNKDEKKYVVNLNFSNKGEFKKTIELNISNSPEPKKEKQKPKKVVRRKRKNIFIDGFFGWNNIKWLIKEIGKLYSSEPSYFSKKRFESSIAFIIAQWGMVLYLWNNYTTLTMSDFLLWAAAEFVIAGYYVTQIQKEKKDIGYNNDGSYTYEISDEYEENSDYQDPNLDDYQDPDYQDPNLDDYQDPNLK